MPDHDTFHCRMAELDSVLDALERDLDPNGFARVQAVVRVLLDLHADALRRLLKQDRIFDQILLRDEAISGMLLLHGLHPLDARSRVLQALERVSPYLKSHGGHVELVDLSSEGVLRLRLHGSCHGCPSSRVTLEQSIQAEVLAAAPEVTSIVVEGLLDTAPQPASHGFVPVDLLAVNGTAPAAATH